MAPAPTRRLPHRTAAAKEPVNPVLRPILVTVAAITVVLGLTTANGWFFVVTMVALWSASWIRPRRPQ